MTKIIKVEWCENWIKAKFAKHPFPGGGFERNHFFDMAEKALANLCEAETVKDGNGNFCYFAFKLKKEVS